MNTYAVIDTNVVVSALLTANKESAAVRLFDKLFSGAFIPFYCKEILDEYNEVLRRPKFGFNEIDIAYLISYIEQIGFKAKRADSNEVLSDPGDLPFYEVALSIAADNGFLVTGNGRHFPKKPFILTPRQFIDILK